MSVATGTRSTRREPMDSHVEPTHWRHQAACRSVDPEIFFPTAVQGVEFERQVGIAKTLCAGCPVRDACLSWAMTGLSDGVAGGMTEHERRTEQARRRPRRPGRLPRPRTPKRPPGASRAEVAAAGRAALAAGMPAPEVAGEFLVSLRTAERWAQAVRARPRTAEGSAGGNRAPLQISHTNALEGTRAEGLRGR
ncbi:WhiB family transcriptional regulator [Pseudonocardia oceani]|uniref:WhiB family transcriptional regulator n=1 Tax=Pseudonocardia oceani TaxID=2792013 RepID=UPI0035590325